ncbi:MAG TPA: response regulator transcription factor [Candidatus Acidoferrum sp.]|jgi:DNA-binding NarL/FixJ family response regulator
MDRLRILIADDHEIFRRGLRSLLESHADFEIIGEAVNGQDALEKTRQLSPDVVILDITMPILNGLDAARAMRKESLPAQILILSQYESRDMRPRALEAGAKDYVSKSDVARDLVAAIDRIVRPQHSGVSETPSRH